jgi:hypothetical protein
MTVKKILRMNKPSTIENIFGWVGTGMVLLAYALNVLGKISAQSLTYGLLNLIGSFGVVYIAYRYGNYQSAVINAMWIVIALIGLARMFS